MEQFEQLLTCAICLDRYRNPKLLPCQHSFCMEPCMDGLVDYVRRQVKCPECRAEHRIPYQGVQGYPTNVTLQRFLELHIEITGELPDPTSGQIMERCNVCSEKAYCSLCVHCEKKICPDCKGAHMDILRREISRINNQVRRALHRLQDILAIVEKNMLSLQQNCSSVTEEVDEIYRRLSKALKDRTEFLRGEIDRYSTTETRNLSTLKENLEVEISNIQANCDLADKHMNEAVDWDDCELMDTKEIFLKTVEFIRNFEYETTDYNRRVRFAMAHDPNQLVLHVAGYGELTINMPHQAFNNASQGIVGSGSSTNLLQPPGPGLMRSKSDHRLATQFRQQEERGYYGEAEEPTGPPRKFGERYNRPSGGGSDRYSDRYGRQDYASEFESPYDNEPRRSGYRSRFRRDRDNDSDNDSNQTRSVRFTEPQHKERERVLDTEDVARGPLSGITRLYDSPRVMKRISEIGKEKKKPEPKPEPPVPKFQPPKKAQRQVSEEDEISRIKKQNKQSGTEPQPETRPAGERVQALRRGNSNDSEERSSPGSPREEQTTRKTPPVAEVPSSEAESEEEEEEQEEVSSLQNKTSSKPAAAPTSNSGNASRRSSASSDLQSAVHKKAGRSASSDSTTSSESSHTGSSSGIKSTGAAYTTEEVKQKILARGSIDKGSEGSNNSGPASGTSTPRGRLSSTGSDTAKKETPSTPKFQSRFLNRQTNEKPVPTKEEEEEEEETDSSSDSETDSEEESEEDKRKTDPKEMDKTDIGPLLARSAQARDTGMTRRDSKDEGSGTYKSRFGQPTETPSSYRSPYSRQEKEEPTTRNRYGQEETTRSRYGLKEEEPTSPRSRYGQDKEETTGSRYLNRNRAQEEEQPKYGGYTSRFLNKSKSTAAVSPDEDSDRPGSRKYSASSIDEDSKYPSGRSRYAALKDRKNRIARSRSSHNFGNPDEDEEDDTNSPTAYLQAKYGQTTANDLSRSRSTHHLKSRENSPDRPGPGSEKDGAALSSWARYLKKFVGNFFKYPKEKKRKKKNQEPAIISENKINTNEENKELMESDNNCQKNENAEEDEIEIETETDTLGDPPTVPFRKNKYGNRGKDGKDTTTNTSVSSAGAGASSVSARRLSLGLPLRHNSTSFESSDDDQKNTSGSPTSPTATAAAGFVAAAAGSTLRNQYLQKRRQLFKIGSRGSEPGCFTWPRGIAVGTDNSIVVADSSNHRVQVFDSNGIFVKEFGNYGNGEGEFDCLAGVAVNRIGQFIIADRYNHRIQVLDPAGRFLRAFGSQGTGDGRFNYPWGITTDALGFIYVCDKENHRVQVFQSDGTFVGKFGSHGNRSGQLEHPHYIAVSNTNRVIVSDSNNHRVQIFDVNGRVLSSFGNEGSEEGQFKFPRDEEKKTIEYIYKEDENRNVEETSTNISQRDEFFSCYSNGSFDDKNSSFEEFLNVLNQDNYEDKVLNYLNDCQSNDKITDDNDLIKENQPRRRYSDISLQVLGRVKTILDYIDEKSSIKHQNSYVFDTMPLSSPVHQYFYHKTDDVDEPKPEIDEPITTTRQDTNKKSSLGKYHPLNNLFNSGPDLSHILKPETIAILNESKKDVNFTTISLLDSLRNDTSGLVTTNMGIAHNTEGGSSRRSGIHNRGRFGEQQDTNLPSGRNIPQSVRLLGIGRRGVQGSGGSSSYEQWKYSSLRSREPPHTSVLSHSISSPRSRLTTSRSFESTPISSSFTIQNTRDRTPSFRNYSTSRSSSMRPSSSSYIQRPRSTIF